MRDNKVVTYRRLNVFIFFQIIAFEHTFGHYHAVSLKTGENLLKRKEAGEVVFFEALKEIGCGYSGKGGQMSFLNSEGLIDLDQVNLSLLSTFVYINGEMKTSCIKK